MSLVKDKALRKCLEGVEFGITALEDEVADLTARCESLEDSLLNKDYELEQLREELADKDKYVERLETELTEAHLTGPVDEAAQT